MLRTFLLVTLVVTLMFAVSGAAYFGTVLAIVTHQSSALALTADGIATVKATSTDGAWTVDECYAVGDPGTHGTSLTILGDGVYVYAWNDEKNLDRKIPLLFEVSDRYTLSLQLSAEPPVQRLAELPLLYNGGEAHLVNADAGYIYCGTGRELHTEAILHSDSCGVVSLHEADFHESCAWDSHYLGADTYLVVGCASTRPDAHCAWFYPTHAMLWVVKSGQVAERVNLCDLVKQNHPVGDPSILYATDIGIKQDGTVWVLAQGLMRDENVSDASSYELRMFLLSLKNPSFVGVNEIPAPDSTPKDSDKEDTLVHPTSYAQLAKA